MELKAKGQVLNWVAFAPGEFTHGYALEHHPVERIRAVLSQKYSRPHGGVNLWIAVPPQAPELPRQRDVKLALEPDTFIVGDTGPLTERVHLIRVNDKPTGYTATTKYEMTLYTNRLVPRAAGQAVGTAKLTPELHAAFTHAADDMKTKVFHEFLDKSQLRKSPQEHDLAFARRTFLYIAKHFTYIYPNPDKVDVVEAGKGDCGGLSWLFVRTMRTSGIAARLILGRWAASEVPAKGNEPRNGQFHVKAEVFIEGLGWVGADLSGGVGVEGNPFVCFGAEPGTSSCSTSTRTGSSNSGRRTRSRRNSVGRNSITGGGTRARTAPIPNCSTSTGPWKSSTAIPPPPPSIRRGNARPHPDRTRRSKSPPTPHRERRKSDKVTR